MREFGYSLNDALNLGYFEIHRLYSIADELKARDLKEKIIAADYAHQNQEHRDKVWEWLNSRQLRQVGQVTIPDDVLAKFAEAFNNG